VHRAPTTMTGQTSTAVEDSDDQIVSTGPQHDNEDEDIAHTLSRTSSIANTTITNNEDAVVQEEEEESVIANISRADVSSFSASSPHRTNKSHHHHHHHHSAGSASSVQVAVRVRPLLSTLESGCGSCIQVLPPDPALTTAANVATTLQIGASSSGPRFSFDEVFPTSTQQSTIYNHRVEPLVQSCLQGYNASLLAYGQTGSGKTHTVIGPNTCQALPDDPSSGMIPRAVNRLFQELQQKLQQSRSSSVEEEEDEEDGENCNDEEDGSGDREENTPYEFQVRVQFLELYGEEIRDLLATPTSSTSLDVLRIRDIGNDEPEVVGALSQTVESAEEALRCLTKGMLRRVTAATAMNQSSSRSHAIFSIMIDQMWSTSAEGMTGDTTNKEVGKNVLSKDTLAGATSGQQVRQSSKFNFVDLAGSERQKRTQATGRRLKEGIDINKGLLVLGNVISALGDPKKRGKAFVPYRDSKLTRLLKGSLGGNHKTLMIACVSPSSSNMEESLNCLRYANRAKNIQNHAVVNVDARSRQIAQLKQQVQALATDLLKVHDADGGIISIVDSSFTRQDLEILVKGGAGTEEIQAAAKTMMSPALPNTPSSASLPLISPQLDQVSNNNNNNNNRTKQIQDEYTGQIQKLRDTEEELNRTQMQLKQSRRDNMAAEERLYVTLAEKEFYCLQLDAVASEERDDGKGISTTSSMEETSRKKVRLDQAFVDRASQYEKEIDRLKNELRVVRSQLVEQRDPTEEDAEIVDATFSIEKASQGMKAERERLSSLQAQLLSVATSPNGTPLRSPGQSVHRQRLADGANKIEDYGKDGEGKSISRVDTEEEEEEAHISALELKYSHVDDDDEVMVMNNQDGSLVADVGLTPQQAEAKASEQRRAQIEADLLEISRIIESKEDLISQLQCSQAKYSSMKEFYEGKLHQMEQLLDKKEDERQKLIIEMERLQENNKDTKEIEAQLKQQDEKIAGIRKQKRQLKDLTAVSSKNADEIDKLQKDVKAMKERKVSMQKQQAEERKAHLNEMRKLKKEMLQKDREARKWQKISNQKSTEADKAHSMAKSKTAQLGQLRAKYKDAEKTIRMLQIKKGVMAKAGLDPIMVGRKESGDQSRNDAGDNRSVDMDLVRDYFDFKVAEVGRKEALADKLARGWEEHFQLTMERSELQEEKTEESREKLQALDMRIQFEEERIRKLANRIGKGQNRKGSNHNASPIQPNSILYGKEFKKLCNGASDAKASEIAAKVLFGMVVRERRRISSLAKTASSLDEKLQQCLMDNEAKEIAFRSYVQDSQQDLANISMNHQEQILSLMSIVKNEKTPQSEEARAAVGENSESIGMDLQESSGLLVLANERIAVLEQQLRDTRAEQKVSETYLQEKEEVQAELNEKIIEYEGLEHQMSGLRNILRQIRSLLADGRNQEKSSDPEEVNMVFKTCLAIIRETLRESPAPLSPLTRRHSCPDVFRPESLSPRTRRQIDFVQSADDKDEEDGEIPDWADEIMADLAFIAEGKIPPSLAEVPGLFDGGGSMEEGSKLLSEFPIAVLNGASPAHKPPIQEDILVDAGSFSFAEERADSVEIESPPNIRSSNGSVKAKKAVSSAVEDSTVTDAATAKSVFDRLVNPTYFTGTQKDKHHGKAEVQREHQESAAGRILDHLLENEEAQREKAPLAETSSSSKVDEYTQQNVFERLQKTTTASYAVKHSADEAQLKKANQTHPVVAPKQQETKGTKTVVDSRHKRTTASSTVSASAFTVSDPGNGIQQKTSPGRKMRTSGIATKERARTPSSRSQTPTRSRISGIRAPQVKSPVRASGDLSPSRAKPPAKSRGKEDYTQQNVFERLTKTTTEAYAVKKKELKN